MNFFSRNVSLLRNRHMMSLRLNDVSLFNHFSIPYQSSVRLTSITPSRPDDRALGVQLPHSLSDPRTSPLRSSRRGGKNVQFGYQRQPPTEWKISSSTRRKPQENLVRQSSDITTCCSATELSSRRGISFRCSLKIRRQTSANNTQVVLFVFYAVHMQLKDSERQISLWMSVRRHRAPVPPLIRHGGRVIDSLGLRFNFLPAALPSSLACTASFF